MGLESTISIVYNLLNKKDWLGDPKIFQSSIYSRKINLISWPPAFRREIFCVLRLIELISFTAMDRITRPSRAAELLRKSKSSTAISSTRRCHSQTGRPLSLALARSNNISISAMIYIGSVLRGFQEIEIAKIVYNYALHKSLRKYHSFL